MSEFGSEKTYAIFNKAANRKIIGDLGKAQAKVILFPPIATEKIVSDESAAIFAELKNFDWLIFADVFAVEYFLETLTKIDFDSYELDDLRVCALGETVSDSLRFASLHADVIPAKVETSAVFSALLEYIGASEIGNLRFLYLTAEPNRSDLADRLRNENADVVELPIYRAVPNETSELIKLKTLLKGGAIDEFILTAPTDLIALENYFHSENLAAVFAEISVSATDGVIFQTAREHDLRRVGLFHLDKIVKVE